MRTTIYLLLSLAALANSALADSIEFRRFLIAHGEGTKPDAYLKAHYTQLQTALEKGFIGTDTAVTTPILEGDKIDFTNTVPFQHPVAYGEGLQPTKLGIRHLGTAVAADLKRDATTLHFSGMYYNASRLYDKVNVSEGNNIALTPVIKIQKISLKIDLNTEKPEWIITPMPESLDNPATYLAIKYIKTNTPSNKTTTPK